MKLVKKLLILTFPTYFIKKKSSQINWKDEKVNQWIVSSLKLVFVTIKTVNNRGLKFEFISKLFFFLIFIGWQKYIEIQFDLKNIPLNVFVSLIFPKFLQTFTIVPTNTNIGFHLNVTTLFYQSNQTKLVVFLTINKKDHELVIYVYSATVKIKLNLSEVWRDGKKLSTYTIHSYICRESHFV